MSELLTVGVAVENTLFHFDKLFDYAVPADMSDRALPGVRVMVPFGTGNAIRQGVILRRNGVNDVKGLKRIKELKDNEPLIGEDLIRLVFFLKDRTFCTYYDAFHCMLPYGINLKVSDYYAALPDVDETKLSVDEAEIYVYLYRKCVYVERGKILSAFGYKSDSRILENMYSKGYLVRNVDADRYAGDLTEKSVRLTVSDDEFEDVLNSLTKKQAGVAKILRDVGSASVKEVCYFTGVTSAVVSALEKKGVVESFESEVYRRPSAGKVRSSEPLPELTEDQQRAFESVSAEFDSESKRVHLLHGITGSGKTLVYIKLIDSVVKAGRSAVLMVPEISLTPQILERFCRHFGDRVAIFHSALSIGERLDEWKRVRRGEASIVIGTRSAVFAPVKDLGLIIIDEEQEHTYKSEKSPRYSAKEAARFRCEESGAVLLLGSATPSVESYARAQKGIYCLDKLTRRFGSAQLPEVVTVDMTEERLSGNMSNLSSVLKDEIAANLHDNKQTILLINRRGYNTFAACSSCKKTVVCPNCSISLTYHSANGRLMCHYCGYSMPFTGKCPDCGKNDLRCGGYGTQLVEEELAQLFPEARVVRMDRDSTLRKNSHEKVLSDFAGGKYDILLGTQMVAKGIDFENVTLVGVVSVDQQLYNDDYRALERTFSLLTQVVGRAGRGGFSGKAVIQTLTPENEIIKLAAKQDYESFFSTEILLRKYMIYPPFCDLCVVGFSCPDETRLRAAARVFFKEFKAVSSGEYSDLRLIVLGPLQPRVSKVCGRHRIRMIVKCKNNARFRKMISDLLIRFGGEKQFEDVSVFADIDPENMN